MIDQAYEILRDRGLVDWSVLLLGVKGALLKDPERLSGRFVAEYATAELANTRTVDPGFASIAVLSMDDNRSPDETVQLVEDVCRSRPVNTALALRKWRAALIKNSFDNLDVHPLYGHLQLMEIWSTWDWPDDAPLSMRKNSVAPKQGEFGSQDAFLRAKQETACWLDEEFTALKQLSHGLSGPHCDHPE